MHWLRGNFFVVVFPSSHSEFKPLSACPCSQVFLYHHNSGIRQVIRYQGLITESCNLKTWVVQVLRGDNADTSEWLCKVSVWHWARKGRPSQKQARACPGICTSLLSSSFQDFCLDVGQSLSLLCELMPIHENLKIDKE